MLAIIKRNMQRLVALANKGSRQDILTEIKTFCHLVDDWLAEEARNKAELARQLTIYFQGVYGMDREEPVQPVKDIPRDRKERNVC